MYSLVLLLVLCFTSGLAAPGFVGGYAPAVSHVSRLDIHNKPIVAAYEGPIGVAAPIGVGAPISLPLGHYGYPAAHSYSNRVDIHSPSYVRPLGHDYGVYGGYGGYGGYGHGHGGYGHAYGLHDGSGYGYAVHGYGVQGLHHGY